MEYATTKFHQFAISHHLNEIDVIEKPVSKTDFHNFGFHNFLLVYDYLTGNKILLMNFDWNKIEGTKIYWQQKMGKLESNFNVAQKQPNF